MHCCSSLNLTVTECSLLKMPQVLALTCWTVSKYLSRGLVIPPLSLVLSCKYCILQLFCWLWKVTMFTYNSIAEFHTFVCVFRNSCVCQYLQCQTQRRLNQTETISERFVFTDWIQKRTGDHDPSLLIKCQSAEGAMCFMLQALRCMLLEWETQWRMSWKRLHLSQLESTTSTRQTSRLWPRSPRSCRLTSVKVISCQ